MLLAFSVAPSGRPTRPADGPSADDVSAGSAAIPADEASVHDAVAEAVRIVRESGLPNHTDSMFTTIEGEWDEVFAVVKRATEAVGRYGSRVSLVIKADIRPGFAGELTGKLDRLEHALGNSADPATG
ncbi:MULTISPECIES: thiamine-binding protein [unclassified Arthrobacter]|uniref:thiamine-binding protein n=1 Tax=unclassified Arthrobacter TaxID=235627 RepID=UPI002DFF1437|nr:MULTISPECIES: thiamine-binding protein [unclassified Arthrobacter]MEC5193327.1 uncharacterized protein YqgV (UPF0045/DUF77 family) [Arthrobacter sp. MP_M4]MEC5204793.1 uncharacterized protein YqgV (UPF0045/DUF77 family) [Arthrobacter sp. MP_M7]